MIRMIRCRVFKNSNGKTEIKDIGKKEEGKEEDVWVDVGWTLDGDVRLNAISFLNAIPMESIISVCESYQNGEVITVYYNVYH